MTETAKPTKRVTKKAAPKPAAVLAKSDAKPVAKVVNGTLYEPVYLHRFLFDNGDVMDVKATRDDSTLRELLLGQRKAAGITPDRICGATRVEFLGYPDMERIILM